MTILANRKIAGDLTSKVLICKHKHYDYNALVSNQRKEFHPGDMLLVLAHEKSTSGASFRSPKETLRFFLDGGPGSLEIDGTFDTNWGIVEPEDRLKGATFVFTGALQNTREYYKRIVEMFGGDFQSTVTGKTKYLVMADKNSQTTKAVKARAQGTILLDERSFMDLIQKGL